MSAYYTKLLEPPTVSTGAKARRLVNSVLPITTWLPHYKLKEYLLLDLLTGVTVALTLIPQGLAYAAIAGIDVTYGLYASLFPAVLYTFFGTSKDLSVGPSPIMASLMARLFLEDGDATPEEITGKVIAISFYTGLIQVGLYLLQAGFILELLSNPIISGFTSGAALTIALGQVDSLLGFKLPYSRSFVMNLVRLLPELGQTNLYALLFGVCLMAFLEFFKRFKVFKSYHKYFPRFAAGMAISILVTWLADLENAWNLPVVGELPPGLPAPQAPDLSQETFTEVITTVIVLAALGIVTNVAIARSFAKKEKDGSRVAPNQELLALGMSNFVGSFFSSMVVSGSFSRSSVQNSSGVKTQMANLLAASMVMVSLYVIVETFYYIPKCALSATIICAVLPLFEFDVMQEAWKKDKIDFAGLMITFVLVLTLGMEIGILFGLLFSLIVLLYKYARPQLSLLGKDRDNDSFGIVGIEEGLVGHEGVVVVRPEGNIAFPSALWFKDELVKAEFFVTNDLPNALNDDGSRSNSSASSADVGAAAVSPSSTGMASRPSSLTALIIDMTCINWLDMSAIEVLDDIAVEHKSRGIRVLLADVKPMPLRAIQHSGMLEKVGSEYLSIWPSVNAAVREVVENGKKTNSWFVYPGPLHAEGQMLNAARINRGAYGAIPSEP